MEPVVKPKTSKDVDWGKESDPEEDDDEDNE